MPQPRNGLYRCSENHSPRAFGKLLNLYVRKWA
jgi:hypothetical protein